MKRMIPLIIILTAIITAVLFFINIKEKNSLFFYNLLFTMLFESLFIIWIGLSVDFKNMNMTLKLLFFVFILAMGMIEFTTLFFGARLFHLRLMSRGMTTMILIESGVEIFIAFIIFAIGNLFLNKNQGQS
jgi:hypothetical protein